MAQAAATFVALAGELVGVHGLVVHKPGDAIGELELAARTCKGDARTPEGFAVEARPANVMGRLSTRHLKNTDFATGPQAIAWSEKQTTWQRQYSDLAEVQSDAHVFELLRTFKVKGNSSDVEACAG